MRTSAAACTRWAAGMSPAGPTCLALLGGGHGASRAAVTAATTRSGVIGSSSIHTPSGSSAS